ncbi:MAG: hypothetical protein K8J31_23680, partial [Anaerolineae bacterium]|nr:hypothetical protein [Anaerolineae bacterium]
MRWVRAAVLIIGFAASILVAPVRAQEVLPVSEGFVFKWWGENIFPEGAAFHLTLSRPVDDLAEVMLTITIRGQEPVVYPVDLSEPAASGPSFTDLDFLWPFPEDAALSLFSDQDVTYEWQASDVQGQTARVVDRLIIRDDRVAWIRDQDPQNFINLTVAQDGPTPSLIRQSVLLPYNLMAANTDRVPEFHIILYKPDLDPSGCDVLRDPETGESRQAAVGPVSRLELPCNTQRAAQWYAANGLDVVQADGRTVVGAQSALVRFMTAQFYQPLWNGADVPDWFLSGLTEFYLPTSKARLLLPVRDAARVDDLLPLEVMDSSQPGQPLWQAQSYAMVLWLADQIGVQGLFDLAGQLGTAPSFQAAYEAAVGQSLDALLPQLGRWAFTTAASAAFNMTPYQAATATPGASDTPIPLPPSATDTAASATPTLTPAVTGVLSPTPTVTRTPTR